MNNMNEYIRKEIKVKAAQFKVDRKPWPPDVRVEGIQYRREGAGKYGEDIESQHWALDANKVDRAFLDKHCDEYKFYMCAHNGEIVYLQDTDWIIYPFAGVMSYPVSNVTFEREYII